MTIHSMPGAGRMWAPFTMTVAAVFAAFALSACTVTQYAKGAVDAYCGLPASARAVNREAVALAVAPNRIAIQCTKSGNEP